MINKINIKSYQITYFQNILISQDNKFFKSADSCHYAVSAFPVSTKESPLPPPPPLEQMLLERTQ